MKKTLLGPWLFVLGACLALASLYGLYLLFRQVMYRLTLYPKDYFSFDVSPDGSLVAFTAKGDGITDLYLLDMTTRKIQKIQSTPYLETEVCFVDQHRLLFSAKQRVNDPQANFELYLLDLRTGHRQQLTRTAYGTSNREPRLLPGGWVHFKRGTIRANWLGPFLDVYVWDPRSRLLQLESGRESQIAAAIPEPDVILPNLRQIITSERSLRYSLRMRLVLVDLSAPITSPSARVVKRRVLVENGSSPEIDPNGKELVFVADPDTQYDNAIYRLNLSSGAINRVLRTRLPPSQMRFVGEWVWFLQDNMDDVRLVRVRVSDGLVEQIGDEKLFTEPLKKSVVVNRMTREAFEKSLDQAAGQ